MSFIIGVLKRFLSIYFREIRKLLEIRKDAKKVQRYLKKLRVRQVLTRSGQVWGTYRGWETFDLLIKGGITTHTSLLLEQQNI